MSTSPVTVSLGSLYRFLYFSVIISTVFYGVVCTQTLFYYIHYQDDPLRVKVFVAVLWAMDTIHQALILSGSYKAIRNSLLNPLGYLVSIPELNLVTLLTTLISFPTQGFFVYRIYKFSGKKIIVPLVWIPFAIYQLVASLLFTGKSLYSSDGVSSVGLTVLAQASFTDMLGSYCAVAATADILIAIAMTYLLARMQSPTGFKSTATLLHRLMAFAINSGFWTAFFALMGAILVQVFPSNFANIVVYYPLSSIYCNTLLANLNVRGYLIGEPSISYIGTNHFKESDASRNERDAESTLNSTTHGGIRMTIEVVTTSDADDSPSAETL